MATLTATKGKKPASGQFWPSSSLPQMGGRCILGLARPGLLVGSGMAVFGLSRVRPVETGENPPLKRRRAGQSGRFGRLTRKRLGSLAAGG
jgi:hypothetical protein